MTSQVEIAENLLAPKDIKVRTYDFGEVSKGPLKVMPYRALAPGIWMGFQPEGSVTASSGTAQDNTPGLFLEARPGASKYMTIEFALNTDNINAGRAVWFSLTASASPMVRVAAVFRYPIAKSEGGPAFKEETLTHFVLDSTLREQGFHMPLTQEDIVPNDECPRPVLLLFLPLSDFSLFFSRLTLGPT